MAHALTIRLPNSLYQAAKRMADRSGISINRLVQEALAEKAEESLKHRLRKAYDLLAEDAEEADVESLLAVQAEVLLDE